MCVNISMYTYIYIIISQPFLLRTGMTRPSLFECRAPEAHETLGGLCVSTGALTLSAGETKRLKAQKQCDLAQFRLQLLQEKQSADWKKITSQNAKSLLEISSLPAIFDCWRLYSPPRKRCWGSSLEVSTSL